MAAEFLRPFKFGKDVLSFVSTRSAGNIGFHCGDEPSKVTANRKALAKAAGFEFNRLVTARQVHGDKVAIVTSGSAGKEVADADALVTRSANLCLMVRTADCVPLLFYDPVSNIIGAAHAGWRGTALRIAAKTVCAMKKLGSEPKDIKVALGPSIGPCCYEVKKDVAVKFDHHICKGNRYFVDLKLENKDQLVKEGILSKNIQISDLCTGCNSDRFFSARAGGPAGRFGTAIALRA